MPLSFVGMLAKPDFSSLAESVVMVDVDGVREKVLVRGPRWVSLSSRGGEWSASQFHDQLIHSAAGEVIISMSLGGVPTTTQEEQTMPKEKQRGATHSLLISKTW